MQPAPPLTFSHQGDIYVLHTNANVRQRLHRVPTDHLDLEIPPWNPVEVISEAVMDLESHHKSTICQVGLRVESTLWT